MASEKPPLTIIRSQTANEELHEIWRWNVKHYTVEHADQYLRYLTDTIAVLARYYAKGKPVAARPDLRYIIIRRRARGHGHVAVYNFDDKEIHVLHIFHTAQNWELKLAEELD